MRQEVIDLLQKIEKMRSAQKRYFKSKSSTDLVISKRLETEIDIDIPAMLIRLKTPQ